MNLDVQIARLDRFGGNQPCFDTLVQDRILGTADKPFTLSDLDLVANLNDLRGRPSNALGLDPVFITGDIAGEDNNAFGDGNIDTAQFEPVGPVQTRLNGLGGTHVIDGTGEITLIALFDPGTQGRTSLQG